MRTELLAYPVKCTADFKKRDDSSARIYLASHGTSLRESGRLGR
ncbi:MAG: hypothetical protein OJF50_006674 [Nitrospira sp.]|nr:hypothetical protein [Nitrospira sp.]